MTGFVALGALDLWRPSHAWLDRLGVYLTGFGVARALGAFAGAPLRSRAWTVTRAGMLAAFLATIPNFVWFGATLWGVAAPALGEPPAWSTDLLLALVTAAVAPLWVLAWRVEARAPIRP